MPPEAASATDVLDIERTGIERWGNLHQQMRDCEDLRFRRHKVDIPPNYQSTSREVRNSIPTMTVQAVKSTIFNALPTIHCPPNGKGREAQEFAEHKEKVFQAMLVQLQREAGRRVYQMIGDSAITKGMGVHKLLYYPEHWTSYTKAVREGRDPDTLAAIKRRSKLPLIWRDVEPTTYYRFDDDDGICGVLEVTEHTDPLLYKKSRQDKKWSQYEGAGRGTPEGAVDSAGKFKLYQYWTRTHCTYVLGDLTKSFRHKHRRVPYFDFAGHESSSSKPEDQYLSSLYPMLDSAATLDGYLTMRHNLVSLGAWPKMVVKVKSTGSYASAARTAEVAAQWNAGGVLSLGPDEEIEFLIPPDSPLLEQAIRDHMELVQQAAPDQILYGKRTGQEPAASLHLAITQARLSLDPIGANCEESLSQLLEHTQEILEKVVKETISISSDTDNKRATGEVYEFNPQDLQGFYQVAVSISAQLPSTLASDAQVGVMLWEAGFLDRKRVLEDHLQKNNPQEILDDRLLDDILESPEVKGQIAQDIMREAGILPPAPPPAPPLPPGAMPPPPGMGGPVGTFPEAGGPGVAQASDLAGAVTPAPIGTGMPGGAQGLGML